jgi:hypothetical protein
LSESIGVRFETGRLARRVKQIPHENGAPSSFRISQAVGDAEKLKKLKRSIMRRPRKAGLAARHDRRKRANRFTISAACVDKRTESRNKDSLQMKSAIRAKLSGSRNPTRRRPYFIDGMSCG